jgi:uncharacterized membrane protein (UPF0127 family)
MKKEIILKYKKRKLKILAEDCNLWKKFSGLMFSLRERAAILLFDFKKRQEIMIHSLFVFYPFIAVWLDGRNNVVDLKIVKPFTFCVCPGKSAYKLVEIPINKPNKKLIKSFFPTVNRNI